MTNKRFLFIDLQWNRLHITQVWSKWFREAERTSRGQHVSSARTSNRTRTSWGIPEFFQGFYFVGALRLQSAFFSAHRARHGWAKSPFSNLFTIEFNPPPPKKKASCGHYPPFSISLFPLHFNYLIFSSSSPPLPRFTTIVPFCIIYYPGISYT